jgi:hypothetical protein
MPISLFKAVAKVQRRAKKRTVTPSDGSRRQCPYPKTRLG